MNPQVRPTACQVLHYQWFRQQPVVKEAARAAHYMMWGSTDSFPILSHEEELEAAVRGLGGREAGLDESITSLLLRQEQGPWRTEEGEERRQEQEQREVQEGPEAVQHVPGAGGKDVAMDVQKDEPVTRQKSSIKQRLRPRRHSNSVLDSLQNRGKRKAVAEERNEVFQAVVSRKRRKSEAQPAHTGREGGRRGRRRSTGVR